MKSIRYSILAAISVMVVFGCKRQGKAVSEVATTSDKTEERKYTMKGVIELPADVGPYVSSWLVDRLRRLDDAKSHAEGAESERARASTLQDEVNVLLGLGKEELTQRFLDTHRGSYPVVGNNGMIVSSALTYWVSKQILYTKSYLSKRGINLAVTKVTPLIPSPKTVDDRRYGTVYRINYEAEVSSLVSDQNVEHTKTGGGYEHPTLKDDEKLPVPENPITVFWEYFGVEHPYLENELAHGMAEDFHSTRVFEKTKTNAKNDPCYTADGDAISPEAFHYYLNLRKDGCKPPGVGTAKIQVTGWKKVEPKTTYPEYHRLFADKEVTVFIAMSQSDSIASQLKTFFGSAERVGDVENTLTATRFPYEEVDDLSRSGATKGYDVKAGEITFKLRFASILANGSTRQKELLRDAVSRDEVVVYCGHAGYGAKVDGFLQPEKYPKGMYQILVLNGCSTYRYGMAQVLTAKSLADFAPKFQNVDIITTSADARACLQIFRWTVNLMAAAKEYSSFHFEGGKERGQKSSFANTFQEKHTWLELIRNLNGFTKEYIEKGMGKVADFYYLVSGELDNHYNPHLDQQIKLEESQSSACDIAKDRQQPAINREHAMAMCREFDEVATTEALAEARKVLRSLCSDFNCSSHKLTISADGVKIPVVSMEGGNAKEKMVSIKKGAILGLTAQGFLKQIIVAQGFNANGYEVAENSKIVFHKGSNRIERFMVKRRTKMISNNDWEIWPYREIVLAEEGYVKKAHVVPTKGVVSSPMRPSTFHKSGTITSMIIQRDTRLNGITWEGGGRILHLHTNGVPREGVIAGEQKIGPFVAGYGSNVTMHPNGRLASISRAVFRIPFVAYDKFVLRNGTLRLDDQGRITMGRIKPGDYKLKVLGEDLRFRGDVIVRFSPQLGFPVQNTLVHDFQATVPFAPNALLPCGSTPRKSTTLRVFRASQITLSSTGQAKSIICKHPSYCILDNVCDESRIKLIEFDEKGQLTKAEG